MYRIDLNCDMGESYGAYRLGQDEELMRHITSANIACGFHAGDPATIRITVKRALENGVAVGAHPGLPDLQGFGRRKMDITPREAYEMMVYQIGAVQAFAASEGGKVVHVKPHGALYNMAANDAGLAEAIAEAIYKVDGSMRLYGLSGSQLTAAGEKLGIQVMHEVFADRTYEEDGSLTPRSLAGSVLEEPGAAAKQVLALLIQGEVKSRQGTIVRLKADTVCVHGDTADALGHVLSLKKALADAGVQIAHPDQR